MNIGSFHEKEFHENLVKTFRILVMFDGRIVGERDGEASEGELGLLMAGVERREAAE